MKRVNMIAMLAIIIFLFAASPASAQTKQARCTFGVDVLRLTVSGIDNKVGDVFTYHENMSTSGGVGVPGAKGSTPPTAVQLDYGVDYTPLILHSKASRQSYMFEGSCRNVKGGWGLVARGWNASFGGALQGEVESPISSDTSVAVTGVGMWGQKITPVLNQSRKSGFSNVQWHGENATKVGEYQILLENSFVNTPHRQLVLHLGVTLGQIKNEDSKGQTQQTHIDDPARELFPGLSVPALKLDNAISLESVSSASVKRLLGPTIGISGAFEKKAFEFDWRITQSLLLGQAQTPNIWVDIDKIVTVDGGETLNALLHGVSRTSQADNIVVPVLDLTFKARWNITRHISVSGGVFSSSWFSVPMAPEWNVPGEWTALAGSGWLENKASPTFKGWTAGVQFKF